MDTKKLESAILKTAVSKSRGGRRPVRVQKLIDKESAGTGWQLRNKSVRAVKEGSALDQAIQQAAWSQMEKDALAAVGVGSTSLKKGLLSRMYSAVASRLPGTQAHASRIAKGVEGGAAKGTQAVPTSVPPPTRAPGGTEISKVPASATVPPATTVQPLQRSTQAQTQVLPAQQLPSAQPLAAPGRAVPEGAPPGMPGAQPAPPTKTTPKAEVTTAAKPAEAAPAKPAETAPKPAEAAPPTAQTGQPATPQQPGQGATAAPEAPAIKPISTGNVAEPPQLTEAVKAGRPGNLNDIVKQTSGMDGLQQAQVFRGRQDSLQKMLTKSEFNTPEGQAIIKRELQQIDQNLKQIANTGAPIGQSILPAGMGAAAKRYGIPLAVGGGLLYGGSKIVGSGQQAMQNPYAPQGY